MPWLKVSRSKFRQQKKKGMVSKTKTPPTLAAEQDSI